MEVWKLICTNNRALYGYAPVSGELVIPEGVESLAPNLLEFSKFTTLRLPTSLKEIGENALDCCKNLKSLTIPSGVMELSRKVFSECNSLKSVDFDENSKLEKIGAEAFNKAGLKSLVLPDGFKTLGSEVFNDCTDIESVTFPASMTDYGFSPSDWGNPITPFVRCKNLKYVVFLADEPEKAVYPVALGKLCDWYVPDHMVDHVKAFIEKAKADYSKVKGVGAKNVKPLSKLKGGVTASAPKKKTAAKKEHLTQAIQMHTLGGHIVYRFAIATEDMHMLDSSLGRDILAARYMRDKVSECSVKFVFKRNGDNELCLDTQVNSATEKYWHSTPKT
ncbi:MAG: leucine-rich repeat domain-containing protein, partial [Allobaculum sp.]|nr:leucine-rich repeat domain-containing protein [Allobaculum sp.]